MFGKIFSSMYEGSMRGKGPEVFALWPYIISNCDRTGHLELNPEIVGFKIGMPVKDVERVIGGFLKPDPKSRSKVEGGRKLEKLGEYLYRVVNYEYYRNIRLEEDRREQNRVAQQRFRDRKKKAPVAGTPLPGETAAVKAQADGHLDENFEPIVPQRTNHENDVQMREDEEKGAAELSRVSPGTHAALAPKPSVDTAAAPESQRAKSGESLPAPRETRTAAVREVRGPKERETSPELREPAGSDLVVPETPPDDSPEDLDLPEVQPTGIKFTRP